MLFYFSKRQERKIRFGEILKEVYEAGGMSTNRGLIHQKLLLFIVVRRIVRRISI
jgi:hypothetical protein